MTTTGLVVILSVLAIDETVAQIETFIAAGGHAAS